MEVPIIRLEIENMRHAISVALSEYAVKLNKDIQDSIAAYCTTENLRYLIDNTVKSAIDHKIESEIRRFYEFGPGHVAVRAAVESVLSKTIKESQ